MRPSLLASMATLLIAAAGCDHKAPPPAPEAAKPAPTAAPAAPASAPPAALVYFTRGTPPRSVLAVLEDGSSAPIALSPPGVSTGFAGVLSGRRVLLARLSPDASVAELSSVRVDGSEARSFGAFEPGKYREVTRAETEGEALVVELARLGADSHDVWSLRAGEAPRLLAAGASIAAVAAGRAAVIAGGDLRSVKLDGSASIALGGGAGGDRLAMARGDQLLLTIHSEQGGDVRLTRIDGSGVVDLGKPTVGESAFALSSSGRVLFTRTTSAGPVLVSVAGDGSDEQLLSAPEAGAKPLLAAEGDVLLASTSAGALAAVSALGGPLRVLDPKAGANLRIGAVERGRVFYVGDTPQWSSLRSAALDGSGVVTLCEKPPWLPFFSGVTKDDRVVFYRSLSGQLEGGKVYSVKLDGSDLRALGTEVVDAGGKAFPVGQIDQDFEAITPSGRVVLEAEFEGNEAVSHLLVLGPNGGAARLQPTTGSVRFAALVP
jgi:hypothetical protein